MGSIRDLVERLKLGDHVRWYAEGGSAQRRPCEVEEITIDSQTATVELTGSRSADYRITVPYQEEPYVTYLSPGDGEDDYGELEWISIVAGGSFQHNSLYRSESQ